jgi:hypothetical protein
MATGVQLQPAGLKKSQQQLPKGCTAARPDAASATATRRSGSCHKELLRVLCSAARLPRLPLPLRVLVPLLFRSSSSSVEPDAVRFRSLGRHSAGDILGSIGAVENACAHVRGATSGRGSIPPDRQFVRTSPGPVRHAVDGDWTGLVVQYHDPGGRAGSRRPGGRARASGRPAAARRDSDGFVRRWFQAPNVPVIRA